MATYLETVGTSTGASTAAAETPSGVIAQTLHKVGYQATTVAFEDTPAQRHLSKPAWWASDNGSKLSFAMWVKEISAGADNSSIRWIFEDTELTNQFSFRIGLYGWDDRTGGNNSNRVVVEIGRGVTQSSKWEVESADVDVHGIKVGDWFAILFSIDYSAVGIPTYTLRLQKAGTSTSYNDIYSVGNSPGPHTIPFDWGHTKGVRGNFSVFHAFSDFWMDGSDTYIDWDDLNERLKFIDKNGYPVYLGATGTGITGSQPKYYVPGEFTENLGTEDAFTALYTPSYTDWGAPSDGNIYPLFSQELVGLNNPRTGVITQTLAPVSQAGTVIIHPYPVEGVITQSLSRTSYTTTGKNVLGEWPNYQSYDKADGMWTPDSSKLTYATFMRVPHTPANSVPTLFVGADGYITVYLYVWDGVNNQFRFYLDTPSSDYDVTTLGKSTHGLEVGDWFALMLSIDYSGASAVFNTYVQKVGELTAYDISATPSRDEVGPGTFDFDANFSPFSLNSHQWYSSQSLDSEISEVYLTDEYVDWSDSATRELYISNTGYPVGLGPTGALLTGTAARIYLPDGDGTDNKGTAGHFIEGEGAISDSSTSPSDGAGGGPWFSQAATGAFEAGTSTGSITQTLPIITQAAKDSFTAVGDQTLPSLTQAGTATFAPGTSTGVITHSTPSVTQALTAAFFAGTTVGIATQTLWAISQNLVGSYGAGVSSGAITQTMSGIVSAMSGTHQRGHYAVGAQVLPQLVSALTATNTPSNRTAVGAQVLPIIVQNAIATYDKGASTGWITNQALPPIVQALTGEVWEVGVISQTLPVIIQIGSATFAPDTSVGSISQTIPFVNQALTGSRLRTGIAASVLPAITQLLTGTFAPDTSTGSMDLILPSVTQSATAQFFPGTSVGVITTILPFISQTARAVTYKIKTPTIRLVWEQPVEELIWEPQAEELIWER
jgi:hypothetical protein